MLKKIMIIGFLVLGFSTQLSASEYLNFNKRDSTVVDQTRTLRARWHHASGNYPAEPAVIYTAEDADGHQQVFYRNKREPNGDAIQLTYGEYNKYDATWGPVFEAGTRIDATGAGFADTTLQSPTWSVFYTAAQAESAGPTACVDEGGCAISVVLIGGDLLQGSIDHYVSLHHYEIKLTAPKLPAYDRLPDFNFGLLLASKGSMRLAFTRYSDVDSVLNTLNDMIYSIGINSVARIGVVEYLHSYRYSGNCLGPISFPEYNFEFPVWSPDGVNLLFSVQDSTGKYQMGTSYYLESQVNSFGSTTYAACAPGTYSSGSRAAPASSLEIWTLDPTADHHFSHWFPTDFDADQPGISYHREIVDGSGNTSYELAGFTLTRFTTTSLHAPFKNQIIDWYGSETRFVNFAAPHNDTPTSRRNPMPAPADPRVPAKTVHTQWVSYERLDSDSYWQIFGMEMTLPTWVVFVPFPSSWKGPLGGVILSPADSITLPATGSFSLSTPVMPASGFSFSKGSLPFQLSPDMINKGVLHLVETKGKTGIEMNLVESKFPSLSTQSLIDQFAQKVSQPSFGFKTQKVDFSLGMGSKPWGKVKLSFKGDSLTKSTGSMLLQLDEVTRSAVSLSLKLGSAGAFTPYSKVPVLILGPRAYTEYQWTYCPHHNFFPEFNYAGLNDDPSMSRGAQWPPDLVHTKLYNPASAWDPLNPSAEISAEDNQILYLYDLPTESVSVDCGCDVAGNTVYDATASATTDIDSDGMADRCDACNDLDTATPNAPAPYNYGYLFDITANGSYSDSGDSCFAPASSDCTDSLPLLNYADTDGDGINDYSTTVDSDGDGIANACDPCPYTVDNTTYTDDDGNLVCGEEVFCCCSGSDTCTVNADGSALTSAQDANGNGFRDANLADGTVCESTGIDTCTLNADSSGLTTTEDADGDGRRDANLADGTVCDICPGVYDPNQNRSDVNDMIDSGASNGVPDECETPIPPNISCPEGTALETVTISTNLGDLVWLANSSVGDSRTLSNGTTYRKGEDNKYYALDSSDKKTGAYFAASSDIVNSEYELMLATPTEGLATLSTDSCTTQAVSGLGVFGFQGSGCGCDMNQVQPLRTQHLITGVLAALLFTLPIFVLRRRKV